MKEIAVTSIIQTHSIRLSAARIFKVVAKRTLISEMPQISATQLGVETQDGDSMVTLGIHK